MKKYVPYIAALMSLMLVNFAAFAQDGTREHPYPIGDISALISFAQCINNHQPFTFEDGKFVFDIEGNIPQAARALTSSRPPTSI